MHTSHRLWHILSTTICHNGVSLHIQLQEIRTLSRLTTEHICKLCHFRIQGGMPLLNVFPTLNKESLSPALHPQMVSSTSGRSYATLPLSGSIKKMRPTTHCILKWCSPFCYLRTLVTHCLLWTSFSSSV